MSADEMKPSLLRKLYDKLQRLPAPLRNRGFSLIFGRAVKYFRTSGLVFEHISPEKSVVLIKNRRRVQNHLGSVHAVAMVLIAESASGALVGLNLGADAVPVIKRLEVDYNKRAVGDMRAEASLSQQQIVLMRQQPRGEVDVQLRITDTSGNEPITARMLWAWTPKRH